MTTITEQTVNYRFHTVYFTSLSANELSAVSKQANQLMELGIPLNDALNITNEFYNMGYVGDIFKGNIVYAQHSSNVSYSVKAIGTMAQCKQAVKREKLQHSNVRPFCNYGFKTDFMSVGITTIARHLCNIGAIDTPTMLRIAQ